MQQAGGGLPGQLRVLECTAGLRRSHGASAGLLRGHELRSRLSVSRHGGPGRSGGEVGETFVGAIGPSWRAPTTGRDPAGRRSSWRRRRAARWARRLGPPRRDRSTRAGGTRDRARGSRAPRPRGGAGVPDRGGPVALRGCGFRGGELAWPVDASRAAATPSTATTRTAGRLASWPREALTRSRAAGTRGADHEHHGRVEDRVERRPADVPPDRLAGDLAEQEGSGRHVDVEVRDDARERPPGGDGGPNDLFGRCPSVSAERPMTKTIPVKVAVRNGDENDAKSVATAATMPIAHPERGGCGDDLALLGRGGREPPRQDGDAQRPGNGDEDPARVAPATRPGRARRVTRRRTAPPSTPPARPRPRASRGPRRSRRR